MSNKGRSCAISDSRLCNRVLLSCSLGGELVDMTGTEHSTHLLPQDYILARYLVTPLLQLKLFRTSSFCHARAKRTSLILPPLVLLGVPAQMLFFLPSQ